MGSTVNILLVDDDEVDVQGLKRAFKKSKIANPITVARDGIEALEVLRGENGRERLPKPHLILLDLNMPRMNGLEFLAEMRATPALSDIPVYITTTSDMDHERAAAADLAVSGYILKPLDFESGHDLVDTLSLLEKLLK